MAIQHDDRITMRTEYGQQIVLTCVNHSDKRWATKNIAPIGCRTIFYNLWNIEGMGPECDCPARDLRPLNENGS